MRPFELQLKSPATWTGPAIDVVLVSVIVEVK